MYIHIERVKKIIEEHGIKYTKFEPAQTFEYHLIEEPFNTPKHGEHFGYGWPTPVIRWCTKHLKTNTSKDYMNGLKAQHGEVVLCTGMAADERERGRKKIGIRTIGIPS